MSRPRDRMSSERRRGRNAPSARAVGQAGEPKAPDVSRANKWGRRPLVHFLKRAGLSKVTRPSPKGGRNPFEASGLASCTARPCHSPITRNGRLRLTANRPYDGNEISHQDPSPALPFAGEGAKESPSARCVAEHRPTMPDATGKGGPGRPYRPRKGSQSLNTGCNPACRTAAATSPTGRSSWMANCSSSSLSPSA